MLVIQSYLDPAKELHFNILWPVYYRSNPNAVIEPVATNGCKVLEADIDLAKLRCGAESSGFEPVAWKNNV